MFLRPDDIGRFQKMVLKEIIQVNIRDERLIKDSFELLAKTNIDFSKSISSNNWASLRKVITNLQGQQNYILAHYLKFLTEI